MAGVWTFGVEPLAQTETAAALLRRVTGLVLAAEDDEPAVEQMIDDLRRAEAALTGRVPHYGSPRVGADVDADGRVYLDHGRDIGAYNPCFPEYEVAVDGDRATGEVTFPIAYEGPPGIVHGGFLALFFDCVVQHHHCEVGQAGKTTSLSLRYRRPAPLLRRLSFTVERRASRSDGDPAGVGRRGAGSVGRIHSIGRILDGDLLLCEAEVDAVAGDRTALPEVSPRRSHP
jgi:acyl-coenzyme A thioesterase PaaI-like protein